MALIPKSVALYFSPESIGSDDGARCGICRFYGNETCQIVEGRINPDIGVCGLYISQPVSKDEAGYAETGPTHCANCEEMLVSRLFGSSRCKKVEGLVEGRACCNLWEPK